MNDKQYWIWLSLGTGIAGSAARVVVEQELEARELYQATLSELIQTELFSVPFCKRLKSVPIQKAQQILTHCRQKGYRVVTVKDSEYPQQFLALPDPPLVLYVQGNCELLRRMDNLPAITVVGTRDCSQYGARVAENMSYDLAEAGFIVVSGMATGIDAFAHTGALRAGKQTIAVLGCGLDIDYPAQNRKLRQRILETGGTVLSELEPQTPVNGRYFPTRNRLLAGLGQGVLVVEASEHSGSLLTAGHALAQGKEVFAVPSDIYDPKAAGTLGLIRDGAIPAINVLDVAYPYFAHFSSSIQTEQLAHIRRPHFQKEKRLEAQRKAVWETEQQIDKRKQEPQKPSAKRKTAFPPVRETIDDIVRQYDTDPKYTRELPQNTLDKTWQQEKARLMQELFGDNREMFDRKEKNQSQQSDFLQDLTDEQKKVYSILTEQPQGLDEIAQRCGMTVGKVTAILFEIGVPDPIHSHPGRRFSRS